MFDVLANEGASFRVDFDGPAGMLVPDPGTVVMNLYGTDGSLLLGPIAIDPGLQTATIAPSISVQAGQIRFSVDGETFFNLISVADLVTGIEQTNSVVLTDSSGEVVETSIG